MKRQKDMTLKHELPRSIGVHMLLEKSREIAPEEMKRLSQSGSKAQLWTCLVLKVKSDAIKNNVVEEPGILGP